MPRIRKPERDKAFELYRDSNRKIPLTNIAESLGLSEGTVRGWKSKDNWEERLNGTLQTNEWNAPKKPGAPARNKNAVGNIGGRAPVGNANAVTHGFFRRIFPDDDDTHAILAAIETFEPLDMIWQNIVIQYTAIVRAQKLMFVRGQDDIVEKLKRQKSGDTMSEEEWEFQYPWDRHASFMTAQSRAMSELRSLIKDFLEVSDEKDIRRAKLEQMQKDIELKKLEVAHMKNSDGDGPTEDDGFITALHSAAREVWDDDDEA